MLGRSATPLRRAALLGLVVLPLPACHPAARIDTSDPQQAAFVELVTPRAIEIQRYLTKPIASRKDGPFDTIEVILAALDRFNDPVKVVGTFHFELYVARPASGDRLGQRVAFWEVVIDSQEALERFWDRPSRYFRFPLKLEPPTLEPRAYVLTARFIAPWGDRLFSQYELPEIPAK